MRLQNLFTSLVKLEYFKANEKKKSMKKQVNDSFKL